MPSHAEHPAMEPAMIVVAGPTAVGKTAYAIELAMRLGTEIISCDSRQFYREMRIGVARPTDAELAMAPHHFIACRSASEPYNIYDYHRDARREAERIIAAHGSVVAVGGSGLYIEALVNGVSLLPDPAPELRARLQQMPLDDKRAMLMELDPDYYRRVDSNNAVRLQRALEVTLTAGRPYSQLLAEQQPTPPPFTYEMRVLQMDPAVLRNRIDRRVDDMMAQGLADEVRSLLPYRDLATLRTVGYSELFAAFDGDMSIAEAVEQIKKNTWRYARKQLTWFRKRSGNANVTEVKV